MSTLTNDEKTLLRAFRSVVKDDPAVHLLSILSNRRMRKLTQKLGLEAAQEVVVECLDALDMRQDTIIKQQSWAIERRISFLFSAKTAKQYGLFVDSEGQLRPLVEKVGTSRA